MNATILSIGDELTFGQAIDTNSAWISKQLAGAGCDIGAHQTVPDDQGAIEEAIRYAAKRSDVLIISGGIGPTADDLTRQSIAAVMGVPLLPSEFWLQKLKSFFEKRGRPMPEMNTIQAMIPQGANLIDNTCGTAAGIDATWSLPGQSRHCRIFAMPGVPSEMKQMFARDVLPHISHDAHGAAIVSRTLHTFGLGESSIAQNLGALMNRQRNPSVGTTVSGGVVSLRINSRFESRAKATEELESTVFACRAALGDLVYGQDDDTLPIVIGRLLGEQPATVSVAAMETVTAGSLSHMLSDAAASAATSAQSRFRLGLVAEAVVGNESLLGLPPGMFETAGVASEAVAATMAHAIRDRAQATFGLATAGVIRPASDAGPPTVAVALSHLTGVTVRTLQALADHTILRERAAKMAMTLLRYQLLAKPLPF